MLSLEMTHTHNPNRPADALARSAIDRANHLLATCPRAKVSVSWAHETAHVGDLSVLALTLLD
jgi:hypothetical protein